MADVRSSVSSYPNIMGRIILTAMEEILGNSGINQILNHTQMSRFIGNFPPKNLDRGFSFEELSQIQVGMEEIFGTYGGHGLALRSGRACFKYGLKEFGDLLQVDKVGLSLLPLSKRLHIGAKIFSEAFNHFSDQRVSLEEIPGQILWKIEHCPVCWGRRSNHPVCHLAVGILQESLFWISGGKFFDVKEVECIAQGNLTCTIAINTEPLI